ncbi:hypothetical protein Fleli_2230 [Bernardetia litoralis DSM 6794]|uniref:Protein SirB1 N-terminal domain-containing protein n=1 Tax=Bernardetia litoralis (strain ATCC 23117 / DSM 6794 / NBRC 15988 / NCIMB 1366 / Fx l1 / Sio-4) TaxID=880071 RepID=I4AKX2_BERLS|nr:hypothetical protein [Bernardetia litoralis]AFM04607.1 hypothetical protein Fleli_2230 [Bernardetia litoralis DSM 6794]
MKINLIYVIVLLFCISCSQSIEEKQTQTTIQIVEIKTQKEIPKFQLDSSVVHTDNKYYNLAFQEINQMLLDKIPLDFKRAVFLVEWAYSQGELDYTEFCSQIDKIANDLNKFVAAKGISTYKTAGNYALFEFFTKPHKMNNYKPYTYDFEDFYGEKDHRSMFVSKLLRTHEGQCRSMPILYKILANEIKANAYLALGPNHMYIKHLDEQNKWVNIELTNGNFSSDSWMISSMDISAESIRKGVYMKELSPKEDIAFCLKMLETAYESQYGYSEFGLACLDTSLHYFPTCIPSLAAKSNTLRHFGISFQKKHGKYENDWLKENYKEFKKVNAKMEELGFREMSPEKYEAWVKSMEVERSQQLAKIK